MKDQITLTRIELLHPDIRQEVYAIYDEICSRLTGRAICRFAYTLRTFKEQDDLYAQGRTKLFDKSGKRLGIVTNAPGGSSYHNYGLALDIVLLIDKNGDGIYESASWDTKSDFDTDGLADWKEIVNIFAAHKWEWGGAFKSIPDAPHFQKTMGYSIKLLKEMFLAQGKPLYIDL